MAKILEIGPGLIPIPPHGFGAIERVIWSLYLALNDLGESVLIYNKPVLDPHELPLDRLIHCHWAGHALVLKKHKIPYAFTSHSHMWRTTDYAAIMGSDVYLALHEGMVPDEYKGHVQIVGNGVDPKFWALQDQERNFNVVACGNYSDRKRLWWMFDLLSALPPKWCGIIVGPNVPTYLGARKHDRVVLHSGMSAKELVDLYNQCMVGFHPASEEAFALVPMEMAACGLMTFVSNDCYVYSPASGIHGFDDVESVADAIGVRVAGHNPQSYHNCVQLNHSWHAVADKVKKGLEHLNG